MPLLLEVYNDDIFAYYLPENAGPTTGGYLGRIHPGGSFKGLTFRELRSLGSGEHNVILNEKLENEPGEESKDNFLGDAGWAHFCQVTRTIIRLEWQKKLDIMKGIRQT